MKDGREAKVNMDEWAFIPMIPFGLLAGYWGTMEVRITGLAEEGFLIRHPKRRNRRYWNWRFTIMTRHLTIGL